MYNSANAAAMQVLANGDIVDCGRLPMTARNSLYKTELCKHFMDNGACRYGSKCQFAHGEEELRGVLRHPKYKTTRCKVFINTGRCMYGSRCRFIHTHGPLGPEEEITSVSSNASDADEAEVSAMSADLLVNPYADANAPIDLSLSFGGLKQVTLTRITSIGSAESSPPAIDSLLFHDPFSDLKVDGDLDSERSTSSLLGLLDSPMASTRATEGTSPTKFSRLSIFQAICREGVEA